jgi:hypothetical protein
VDEFGPVTFPAYEGATSGLRSLPVEVDYETRDDGRSPEAVLRMLKGRNMCTPTSPLLVTVNGRHETLRPGISRLRVDHELVRQQPCRFRPADPTDTATRSRLAKLTGSTRTGTTPHARVLSSSWVDNLPRQSDRLRLLRPSRVLP